MFWDIIVPWFLLLKIRTPFTYAADGGFSDVPQMSRTSYFISMGCKNWT